MAKLKGLNIREIPPDLLTRFKMLVLRYDCRTQGKLLSVLVELGEIKADEIDETNRQMRENNLGEGKRPCKK
mgnify:FL=1